MQQELHFVKGVAAVLSIAELLQTGDADTLCSRVSRLACLALQDPADARHAGPLRQE